MGLLGGILLLFQKLCASDHQIGKQAGASNEAPTNSRGCVGCRSRGGVIARIRLDLVGAVAENVGGRWKRVLVKMCIFLQMGKRIGYLVRQVSLI